MRKIYSILAYVCIGSVFFIQCSDSSSSGTEEFEIQGIVFSVTGLPVSGVTVSLNAGTDQLGTTTTNAEGVFEFENIPAGSYDISLNKQGYDELVESVVIEDNASREFTLTGPASISGQIVNSQTGSGLQDASVRFFEGLTLSEADTTNPVLSTTTDISGNFNILQAPAGSFVCVVTADGFITRVVEEIQFQDGQNFISPTTLVKRVQEGDIRIVLTWGENPEDLDTHLTGPVDDNSNERFHLYFVNMNPVSTASLDVDDVTSFGPETTTLTDPYEGTYRYSVHNFTTQNETGALEIEQSPALVEIFDSSGKVASFEPPSANSNSGNVWRVFELEVSASSVDITELGTYDFVSDIGDESQFKRASDKHATYDENDF